MCRCGAMQSSTIDIDGPTLLEETSNSFLRAIKNEFGDFAHKEVFDALKPILGKEWANRQVYWKLAAGFKDMQRIRILHNNSGLQGVMNNKINAIKCLRALTSCGLVEAKNAIEKSYDEAVVVALRKDYPLAFAGLSPADPRNQSETSDMELEAFLVSEIKKLRTMGWSVEMA